MLSWWAICRMWTMCLLSFTGFFPNAERGVIIADHMGMFRPPQAREAAHEEKSAVADQWRANLSQSKWAAVVLQHINRAGTASKKPEIHNLAGTDAAGQLADVVLALTPQEEDPARRWMGAIKNRRGPPRACTFEIDHQRLTIEDTLEVDP